MNIDYTLWPNANGTLGQNKVSIPDGVTVQWPEGDALVGNFVYKDGLLSGFVDTKALIVNESKSTTFPYDYVNIAVDKSLEGTMTFNKGERTKHLTITYSSSDNSEGSYDYIIIDFNTTDQTTIDVVRTAKRVVDKTMYAENGSVIGTWDTSKIEVGGICDEEAWKMDGLFCNFNLMTFEERGLILTEFNSDLSGLTDGSSMFAECVNLTSFTSNLSSLTNGYNMFSSCNFTSFSSDLSNLMNGQDMFNGCSALTSFFSSDLSSLTNGERMFQKCSILTSFNANLPSLTDGLMMFYECKLDAPSVKNIIDTINTYSATLTLGMGCDDTETDKNLFAQEVGYTDMATLLQTLQTKGWTVEAQYNGRPTTTYGLRRPSEDNLPVFVKLEEVEETHDKSKSFHTHTSIDETKKYRLDWFHETTGSTEGYTQFNSLEEAIEALNIKPIESI